MMKQYICVNFYRNLQYAKVENKVLTMDLYVPQSDCTKAPVVLWIPQGGGLSRAHMSYGPPMGLVERGYAIAKIDYRMSYEAIFPASIQDCKTAVRFLKAHAGQFGLDANRVGSMGESVGGYLSLMMGLVSNKPEYETELYSQCSSEIIAVCDIYGPSNFLTMGQQEKKGFSIIDHNAPDSPESKFLGGPVLENKDKAMKASPIAYIKSGSNKIPPIIIFHGDKDPCVPYEQSVEIYDALKSIGADVSFYTIPGGDHSLEFFPEFEQKIIDFFDKNMKS